MILFLYGEDTFRLNQKVKALKEKFISASLGDTNLAVLDGEKISYDEIVRQVLAMPFLAKSRLVIVGNLTRNKQLTTNNKFVDFLPKVPKTTVLVITEEGNPDKRTALYKRLNKPPSTHSTSSVQASSGQAVQSQEFKLLEPDQVRRWVIREIENRESKIEGAAVSKLIEYVGSDLWRMKNEIDKLSVHSLPITVADVELLVVPQIQSNIFNLMDNIAAKNTKASLRELYKLLNEGKAEAYILSMIVMEYRNLLIVKDLSMRSGRLDRWTVARGAGLHPFVAQKTLAIAQKYSLAELKKIYRTLLSFDTKIKTGKMESRVALELLVYKLTTHKFEARNSKS